MNAILAQVGLASGATQRAHMLLTTKLVIVLALGTAAHIWTLLNLQQTLFEAFYGCERFTRLDQVIQCRDDLYRRTQWISVPIVLLTISFTFYTLSGMCHRFSKAYCWDWYKNQPSEAKATKVLMKIFGGASLVNLVLILIMVVP